MIRHTHDRSRLTSDRAIARLVLFLFATLVVLLLAVTWSPQKSGFADAPSRGPSDIDLYRAEVERMRGGCGYYDTAQAELHARGYPTRSVFNWRTPLPMWLIAAMPDNAGGKVLLGLLCLSLVWTAFHLLADEGRIGEGFLGVTLLSGALLPCILGDLLMLPELWSGVLVALSATCFGLGHRKAGLAAGVAALLIRELAAPYVLVCIGLAAYERRGRELAAWGVALLAYAAFFGMHAANVLPRISLDDVAHSDGWIRFGGPAFLISTVQMNAYLLLLPQWVAAVYLAAVLLGCAAWRTAAGTRIGLTIAIYCMAFCIAGNDFNQYWGSMTAPLFCLAASRAPSTLKELVRTAWSHAPRPRMAGA